MLTGEGGWRRVTAVDAATDTTVMGVVSTVDLVAIKEVATTADVTIGTTESMTRSAEAAQASMESDARNNPNISAPEPALAPATPITPRRWESSIAACGIRTLLPRLRLLLQHRQPGR